jgi:protein SCO1/2
MKPFLTDCCMIASMLAFLLFIGNVRADSNADNHADPLAATVQALGRLNGQALSCGHKEVAARIKQVMITRVPKTRELGEAFERATTDSFLAQGKSACPGNASLRVEVEVLAVKFAPAVHVLADGATPDVGINPRYLLQATNGRSLMDGDFPKHFQLIAFGYTFCPDICPTTLQEMTEVLKQLGEQAGRIQPLFISVDPERDTLPQLESYVAFFDKRILGATGTPALVKRAAENYKVRYEKVSEPGADPKNYAVDHTAGMYLLAPGGQFIAKFAYATPVAELVERIKAEIRLRPLPVDNVPPAR